MGIYAREPRRLVAQVSADALVLGWAVLWWLLSRQVERVALEVAAPARQAAETARAVSGQFRDASEQAGRMPAIGSQLRQPFDAAAGSFGSLVASAEEQVRSIERLAAVLGWLVFLIPVSVILLLWLPRRIAFLLRARAAERHRGSGAALDLMALRALVSQPVSVLTTVDPEPASSWRAGNATVITQLADVELRRSGLAPGSAARLRRTSAGAP